MALPLVSTQLARIQEVDDIGEIGSTEIHIGLMCLIVLVTALAAFLVVCVFLLTVPLAALVFRKKIATLTIGPESSSPGSPPTADPTRMPQGTASRSPRDLVSAAEAPMRISNWGPHRGQVHAGHPPNADHAATSGDLTSKSI